MFDFIGDLPVSGWNIKGFDIKFMRRYKEELLNEKFHNRAYDGILTAREWFNNDRDVSCGVHGYFDEDKNPVGYEVDFGFSEFYDEEDEEDKEDAE